VSAGIRIAVAWVVRWHAWRGHAGAEATSPSQADIAQSTAASSDAVRRRPAHGWTGRAPAPRVTVSGAAAQPGAALTGGTTQPHAPLTEGHPLILQWVVTGYAMFDGPMLLSGRVGDLFGRRQVGTTRLLLESGAYAVH
jgi:hypothetical protein